MAKYTVQCIFVISFLLILANVSEWIKSDSRVIVASVFTAIFCLGVLAICETIKEARK